MPVYFLRNSSQEGRTTEMLSVLQIGSTEREGGMRASERRAASTTSLVLSPPPSLPLSRPSHKSWSAFQESFIYHSPT